MRVKPRVAGVIATAVVAGLSWGAAAQAGAQIPSGNVTAASVQQLQTDATNAGQAATDAARDAALAQQALAAAKAAAQAASDHAAQTGDPADIAAAAAAQAAQAAAQSTFDTKSAAAAKAAADAATATDNANKETQSFAALSTGTSTEGALGTDTDAFPDNAGALGQRAADEPRARRHRHEPVLPGVQPDKVPRLLVAELPALREPRLRRDDRQRHRRPVRVVAEGPGAPGSRSRRSPTPTSRPRPARPRAART